jgi:hypothetical protein
MPRTIAQARADQAAVALYDQVAQIASALKQLKSTVERATGFKQNLINNGDPADVTQMLSEVSEHSALVWQATEADLIATLDVVSAMLPNPDTPGNAHTRNTLLDSLKTVE